MNYQIVLTPYLNNRSYFYHTPLDNCELVQLSPRESIKALLDGHVLAGVVPIAGLEQLENQFELLGNFGIASEGAVQSVLFFSQRPFESFTANDLIKLSSESLTSINLLGLLFGYQQGFDMLPKTTNEQELIDGELLIGDAALKRQAQGKDLYVTDLAQQWTQYHRLPFVFARWVIHKDAPNRLRNQLEEWLTTFVENEIQLHHLTAEQDALRFNIAPGRIVTYLQGIKTFIDERKQAGQALYLSELHKYKPIFNCSNKQPRKQCA